ncbi:MAG TPA: hypothetical protein VFG29_10785 [Syntrophales bacterium]|nr:hypothetical protein [Syntrophales bacterium]
MSSIGLLVGCEADRAFRMIRSIIMVVKGHYKNGKQEEDCKKK